MKKALLFFLTLLPVLAFAEVQKSVTFNFLQPETMTYNPAFDESTWKSRYYGQLPLTDKTVSVEGSPIQIKFERGMGNGGVVIEYKKFPDDPAQNYHSLQTRTSSLVTVTNTTGCKLDSIHFYGSMGSLAGPSTGDIVNSLWFATSPTETVRFENQGIDSYITQMVVYYQYPSKPMNFLSASPNENTKEKHDFKSMTLQFDLSIAKFNATGITMTGPGIDTPVALTATVSGSVATLTAPKTYTEYGEYTVTIPAGTFKNSEGGSHEAITVTFKLVPEYKTVKYTSVDPEQGTYAQLPEVITLTFDEYVSVKDNTTVALSNGKDEIWAKVTLNPENTKQVLVTHGRGQIKDEGTWTYRFPEQTIYNGMMGDEIKQRWNPDFKLEYEVKKQETEEEKAERERQEKLQEAKDLLTTANQTGYPTTSSDGYQALKTATENEQAPIEEINEAISKYYAETNVKMLENGKWYRVANVNADGTKVYLTYDNQKITLKTAPTCKDAYQVSATNNGIELKTKDNRYVTVLGNPSGFEGFVYNKSGKASQLTLAKLQVGQVDPAQLLGKFSITGWLGRDANDEDMGTTTAAIEYPGFTVMASPTAETYFSSNVSSAFVFEEASEPCEGTLKNAEITFTNDKVGIELEKAGDPATIMVLNVASADIANPKLPYYKKQNATSDEEDVEFEGDILKKDETTQYYFTVNTAGLEAGDYLLYIPAETFKYVPWNDNETVTGTLTRLSVRIKNNGTGTGGTGTGGTDDTKTPEIRFANGATSFSVEKAGDDVTLNIINADNATIKNASLPYFVLTSTPNGTHTTATIKASGNNQFTVSTTGLKAETYSLVIPAGTFSNDAILGTLTVTVKKGTETQTGNFIYNFAYTANPKVLLMKDVGRTVVYDVELNDIVIVADENINPNTKAELVISNLNGSRVKAGHLEAYPNFSKEVTNDFLKGSKALKLVLDEPFVTNELYYKPGIYFLEIPAAAFGDDNFGKWLKNNNFTGTCVVNKESKNYFCWQVVPGSPTGIDDITSEPAEREIYDLSGRRVEKMKRKGVYIVNGKKVVLK